MIKINILIVVIDHFGTLRNANTGKLMWGDLFVFYALPVILSIFAFKVGIEITDTVESSLIAVFAVFAALLFSAQIGLYGLFAKSEPEVEDKILLSMIRDREAARRRFFKEVNANVSYLILLSCLSLIVLIFTIFQTGHAVGEAAVLICITTHFLLTLLMVIKRVHVAFAERYAEQS